jgi:hypothetical protein
MSVEKELNRFGKVVVKEARTALTKQDRNVSRELYNSLRYDLKVSKNSFELSFNMEDYGKFQDKGVKGKTSSAKAPNSPFKFGSGTGKKGGLTSGIFEWVKARRFQFRDRNSGKFMSYKSTAFLISRSVYHKGTKPTKFFTKPFESAFKRLPDDIIKAYGLTVEKLLINTSK